MEYIAKIIFSNKELSGLETKALTNEFVERRHIAVDILNPMYEKWNEEFDNLYPDKDGYSYEYSVFMRDKQKDAIDIANAKSIGMNRVKLHLDYIGDIFGVDSISSTIMELRLIKV